MKRKILLLILNSEPARQRLLALVVAGGFLIFNFSLTSTAQTGATCVNPVVIPAVPYADFTQCTQGMGNDYQSQGGICNTSYAGEDLVYSYTTFGPECDSIILSATSGNPALAIYMGCPGITGTICLTPTPLVGNGSMQFTFPSAGTYYIIVDATAGYACYDLNIIPCAVGIDENVKEENLISLSPTPATGELSVISYQLLVEKVEIYDVLGEKCLTPALSKGEGFRVDVSSLAAGIYFVRLKTSEGMRSAKFVKE